MFSRSKSTFFVLVWLSVSMVSSVAADERTLRDVYEPYFLIGAAVGAGEKKASGEGEEGEGFNSFKVYKSVLDEFSSLTPENAMKAHFIRRQNPADDWKWEPADAIVDHAQKHGQAVRGHALVWGKNVPAWMFKTDGTQEEKKAHARAQMETHIRTLVGRYKGRVCCWDVVNEALVRDLNSQSNSESKSIYRTNELWYKAYGDAGFIRDAFQFARQADPKAKLFYNDFDLAYSYKRDWLMEMLKEQRLIEDKLIDGIGMQGHYKMTTPTLKEIEDSIEAFAALGLDIHITELDIEEDESDSAQLAQRYADLFALFRKHSDKISSVTLWGVADDHTWQINKNAPWHWLLWDKQHQPKEAYFKVRDF